MSAATLAALVIAATIALSPPVLADPTADPGDVQALTPPPSLASTPAPDEQFLADLTNAGMRIADVSVAIVGAHDTCAFIAARHTATEAMQTGMANNPTMTRADEDRLCPSRDRGLLPALSRDDRHAGLAREPNRCGPHSTTK